MKTAIHKRRNQLPQLLVTALTDVENLKQEEAKLYLATLGRGAAAALLISTTGACSSPLFFLLPFYDKRNGSTPKLNLCIKRSS